MTSSLRQLTVFLSLLLILSVSCLITGCTSPGGNQSSVITTPTPTPDTTPVNAPPVSATTIIPVTLKKISFGMALDALRGTLGTNVTILYIHGEDVDTSGLAKMWTFGLKKDGEGVFFALTGLGESVVPWPGNLPTQEIELDRMVLPDALVKKNRNIAGLSPQGADNPFTMLELRDGLYMLTTIDGTIYTFDQITGNPVKE